MKAGKLSGRKCSISVQLSGSNNQGKVCIKQMLSQDDKWLGRGERSPALYNQCDLEPKVVSWISCHGSNFSSSPCKSIQQGKAKWLRSLHSPCSKKFLCKPRASQQISNVIQSKRIEPILSFEHSSCKISGFTYNLGVVHYVYAYPSFLKLRMKLHRQKCPVRVDRKVQSHQSSLCSAGEFMVVLHVAVERNKSEGESCIGELWQGQ